MYPEGTRSEQEANEMLPLKKGGFHTAVSGQMPIIPIVISTYGDIFSVRRKKWEGGTIRIKGMRARLLIVFLYSVQRHLTYAQLVLEPIQTKGMLVNEVNSLMEKTRTAMLHALNEISPPPAPNAKRLNVKSTVSGSPTDGLSATSLKI